MTRIFLVLALFAVLLLVTNMVLGLRTGDYNGLASQYVRAQRTLREMRQATGVTRQQLQEQQEVLKSLGQQIRQLEGRCVVHFLFGLAAALVTVLVNSITVTYFIGTSRWCKEVVETYGLDTRLAAESAALKRHTFPWALGGILVVLVIIALGGAALPFGATAGHSAQWVTPHWCAAVIGTALIGWSFAVQASYINANYEIIQRILKEVERIRAARGLDPSQTASS